MSHFIVCQPPLNKKNKYISESVEQQKNKVTIIVLPEIKEKIGKGRTSKKDNMSLTDNNNTMKRQSDGSTCCI